MIEAEFALFDMQNECGTGDAAEVAAHRAPALAPKGLDAVEVVAVTVHVFERMVYGAVVVGV